MQAAADMATKSTADYECQTASHTVTQSTEETEKQSAAHAVQTVCNRNFNFYDDNM